MSTTQQEWMAKLTEAIQKQNKEELERAAKALGAQWADQGKPNWDQGTMRSEWLNQAVLPPKREYLLKVPGGPGVIPMGVQGLLVAPGAVGKSHILTQLALSVASGVRWLGLYEVATPGRVACFMGEEPHDELHRRFHANFGLLKERVKSPRLIAYEQIAARIHPFALQGEDCQLLDREGKHTNFFDRCFEILSKAAEEDPFRCIIFDPLSQFSGIDSENDNAQASRFMSAMGKFAAKLPGKPTVILAHHTGKTARDSGGASVNAARGAGAFSDNARFALNLERIHNPMHRSRVIPGMTRLSVSKNNYGSWSTSTIDGETVNGTTLTAEDDPRFLHALWYDPTHRLHTEYRELIDEARGDKVKIDPEDKALADEIERMQDAPEEQLNFGDLDGA